MDSKTNILIVDDRPENLLSLTAMLEEPGINIIPASSGNEALRLLLQHDFALVFLDVQMPDMNGFEVAELMRSKKKTRTIPIIFITALSKDQGHIFKGYESGAVDYICKPILEPLVLRSKMQIFCQLQQQRQQIENQLQELADKNKLLKKQLDEIKTLRGIIPICSVCKKIRDDQGYWKQLETYLHNHSGIDFSHGYCPECANVAMAETQKITEQLKNQVALPDGNDPELSKHDKEVN
jgi:CheY-like chemotaxis protein